MRKIFYLVFFVKLFLITYKGECQTPNIVTMVTTCNTVMYHAKSLMDSLGYNVIDEKSILIGIALYEDSQSQSRYWHVLSTKDNKDGYVYDNSCLKYNETTSKEIYIGKTISEDSAALLYAIKINNIVAKKIKEKEQQKQKAQLWVNYFSWSYENEYSSFATVEFSISNYSKKTIKYVFVHVGAKDAVNEPILSFGKKDVVLKGVGPISPNDKGEYQFESAFYSKIISTMHINKIEVQYMDNTKRSYLNVNQISDDD